MEEEAHLEKVQERPCVEVLAVPGVGEGLHIWIDRCSSPSRREGTTLLQLSGGGKGVGGGESQRKLGVGGCV